MRIAFLNPTATLGGAERCLLALVERLKESHPDWELAVVASSTGPLVESVRRLGIPCHVLEFPSSLARLGDAQGQLSLSLGVARLPASFLGGAGYVRRLKRLLKELSPDIVHTNGLKMHALGALAKPHSARLLWHVHDYASTRPVMARLLRILASQCDLAVANSNSVAADLRSVCPGKLPVATILNGVDLDHFTPLGPRLDLDRIAGVESPPGVVRVGLVATMAPWKGHDVFMRALALLPADASVRGYVIGGAIYKTDSRQTSIGELRRLANMLRIDDRVVFTGFLDDVASAMRSLDIVVHASTSREPFGLVIIEAMACGRPVVVSSGGGAAEIVEGRTFALCNSPGDVGGMAGNIEILARDSGMRTALGAASRREAEMRFDNKNYASAFSCAYQRLVNSN